MQITDLLFLIIFPAADMPQIEFLSMPAAPNDFSSSLTDCSSVLKIYLLLFKTVCLICISEVIKLSFVFGAFELDMLLRLNIIIEHLPQQRTFIRLSVVYLTLHEVVWLLRCWKWSCLRLDLNRHWITFEGVEVRCCQRLCLIYFVWISYQVLYASPPYFGCSVVSP